MRHAQELAQAVKDRAKAQKVAEKRAWPYKARDPRKAVKDFEVNRETGELILLLEKTPGGGTVELRSKLGAYSGASPQEILMQQMQQKRLEAEQRRIETKEKEAREMIMQPARAMALRQVILRCMSQRAGAIRDREEHAAQKKHKKKAKFELQKASSLRARRAAYERISSPKAAEASYVTDGDRTEVIVETMEEQSRKANAAARRAKDKVAKLAVRRPRKESV